MKPGYNEPGYNEPSYNEPGHNEDIWPIPSCSL